MISGSFHGRIGVVAGARGGSKEKKQQDVRSYMTPRAITAHVVALSLAIATSTVHVPKHDRFFAGATLGKDIGREMVDDCSRQSKATPSNQKQYHFQNCPFPP